MSVVLTDVAAPLPRRISARLGVVDWTTRRWRRWAVDVAAVALLYYGSAKLGYQLEVRRAGRRNRLAAGRDGHRLPVDPGAVRLARRADGGPPRQQLRHASRLRRARADVREHDRGARRGCSRPQGGPAVVSALDTMSGVARLVFALVLGLRSVRRSGRSRSSRKGLSRHIPCRRSSERGGSAISAARSWSCRSPSPGIAGSEAAVDTRARRRSGADDRRCRGVDRDRSRSNEPLVYLAFPALGWAAVRFGPRGATLAVTVSVVVTVWSVTHYQGPFVLDSITRTVLSTQLYIAVAAVSSLCLAALVSEREAFAERLGRSRRDVFSAAEAERRRIERNLHDGAQQRLLALAVRLRLAAERARVARDPSEADLARAERELYLALDELRELSHGTHPSGPDRARSCRRDPERRRAIDGAGQDARPAKRSRSRRFRSGCVLRRRRGDRERPEARAGIRGRPSGRRRGRSIVRRCLG